VEFSDRDPTPTREQLTKPIIVEATLFFTVSHCNAVGDLPEFLLREAKIVKP
jgi:hypothetical protein